LPQDICDVFTQKQHYDHTGKRYSFAASQKHEGTICAKVLEYFKTNNNRTIKEAAADLNLKVDQIRSVFDRFPGQKYKKATRYNN
jgi:hypothetical protein